MLIKSESRTPFDDEEYIFEPKWDGLRCIAYLDVSHKQVSLRNKKSRELIHLYPELKDIWRAAKSDCVLDGELVLIMDGNPNFERMQKRSIMKNDFKIATAAQLHPVTFVAFDMLYQDGKYLLKVPLMDRKNLLEETIKTLCNITVNVIWQGNGVALYNEILKRNWEGIVAKKKESLYYPGKRTPDWIKIKNMNEDDFIVCGYFYQAPDGLTLILGQFDDSHNLTYRCSMALGVENLDFIYDYNVPRRNLPVFSFIMRNDINWLEPVLVCTARYMYQDTGKRIRQPVLKGYRSDKSAEECIMK